MEKIVPEQLFWGLHYKYICMYLTDFQYLSPNQMLNLFSIGMLNIFITYNNDEMISIIFHKSDLKQKFNNLEVSHNILIIYSPKG